MNQDQINIIRLIRSENIGAKTFYNLINHFGSSQQAVDQLQKNKSFIASKKLKLATIDTVEEEISKTHKMGGRFIFLDEEAYPENLKYIDDPPPFIIALGNLDLLNPNIIAVVGARNASFNSTKYTEIIVNEITKNDFVTVSGMARGIDTAVHKSCLQKTIAVLAGGIDFVYPPENKELYEQIKNEGCIIAENKIAMRPSTYHFPQRNRLVAGLAKATIIVEATIKSGSLITARFAANYNREVFAVPGFPMDMNFSGNNYLIKNGAHLLDNPKDIFSEIQFNQVKAKPKNFSKIKVTEKIEFESQEIKKDVGTLVEKIMEKISSSPVDIDDIGRELQITPAILQGAILKLELSGELKRVGNNSVARISFNEYAENFEI
ncbi:MAG: DNA-processing protein DprA [Rickettsiales bacterium]